MRTLIILVAIVCCASFAALAMPRECAADPTVTLAGRTEEGDDVVLEFKVDFAAAEPCLAVAFDLVLELKLPNGQWKSIRIPGHAEIQDGASSQIVRHTTTDLELLEYRVRIVDCSACAVDSSAG